MGRRDDDGIDGILLGLGALVVGGYGIYKAIKNANNPKQNKPPQIKQQRRIVKPSDYEDLLNFDIDYIDLGHVLYCRVIPSMAALFSSAGFIDIRNDNEEIDKYIELVHSNLKEMAIQSEYADRFIKKSIDLTYQRQHSSGEYISRHACTYIKSFFPKDFYGYFFSLTLILTQTMNGAAFSYMYSMAQEFEISKSELRKIAIEAGYKDSAITFPKLPITPRDYNDLLDFNEDHILGNYHDKGYHVLFCRLIPTIAAYISRISRCDIRINKSLTQSYIRMIENRDILFPKEMVAQFVNTIIDLVYSNNSAKKTIKEKLQTYISQLPPEIIPSLIKDSITLTDSVNSSGWNALYDLVKEKISLEELENLIKNVDRYCGVDLGIVDDQQMLKCLKILGLTESATKNDIVKAYKTLSLKFHPDTIASKGLDEEFLIFAQNRFIEIKDAYDYLKEKYN